MRGAGNWLSQELIERQGLRSDQRAERVDLRTEVTQLRMERDLLKRSMAMMTDRRCQLTG
jgi:hypothetical protein